MTDLPTWVLARALDRSVVGELTSVQEAKVRAALDAVSELVVPDSEQEECLGVEQLLARAMTRLNKLRVPNSVSQQRYLTEARDFLADALDRLQAVEQTKGWEEMA